MSKVPYWGWLCALAVLTVLRIGATAWLPLTPDEAYYRVWALAPAAGYLDHPPMVAVFIRLGMALAGDTACGVRLLGPVSAALGSLFLALATRRWGLSRGLGASQATKAGIQAAVLLNGTLALGVGTILITPDTPLLFFMALFLWSLTGLLQSRQGWWWLIVGVSAGLGFTSKYTAILPVVGLCLWLLAFASGRMWLKTIWPWLGGLCATLCLAPVVWWNAHHGWASFLKQGGRAGDWHPNKIVTYFGELLGGQIGLATPGIFLFFVMGAVVLFRQKDAISRVYTCMIAVSAAVFIQHAFGARVQANWPVVLYPILCMAATLPAWRWWKAASGFGVVLVVLVIGQALAAPLKLSPHFDMTLRQMGGWAELAPMLDVQLPEHQPLIADEYGLAAELAFYAPASRPVVAVEPRWALFALQLSACTEGYLIRSHRRHDEPDPAMFTVLEHLPDVVRARRGVVADTYSVYKVRLQCTASGQGQDAVLLPRHS